MLSSLLVLKSKVKIWFRMGSIQDRKGLTFTIEIAFLGS